MPARWAIDSQGRTHYLLHQEQAQSCGPACVAMAEQIYKQACMIDPEGRARQISQLYPGSFDPKNGTQASNLSYVLNHIGVPAYRTEGVAGGRIFDYFWYYCGSRTPIIAHIAWAGGGGHFTLLVEINRTTHRMLFYDPWYDVVEVDRANLPNYNAGGGANGTLSGWMTITHR
ncbi:MAG: hypothetical protein C4324_02550 [Blastocatellia bacterium]